MKTLLRILLFLLSLNLLSENLGYLTHQLYQFLGIACLLFYGLSMFPYDKKTESRGLLFLGFLLLIVSFPFFGGSILARLVGTALFLFSLDLILKSKSSKEKEIPLLFSTVALYFYFLLFYLYSPPFWYAMKEVSLSFSQVISSFTGSAASFSSTFLGLPITVLFTIFIILSFISSGKKKPALFVLSLVSLIVLSGFYPTLVEYLPSPAKKVMGFIGDENNFIRLFIAFLFEKNYPLARNNSVMYGPLLLFFLYGIPLLLIFWRRDLENVSPVPAQGKLKNGLAFLLITALATSVLTIDLPGTLSEKRGVVLYDKGFLNWHVPDFRMFGSKSAGMFGNLPLFLEAMGFSTVKTATITKEVLKDAKILMMINLDQEIPPDELKPIWNFVEEGGSLLLLGDHTFYKRGIKRIILNDVLAPYSIRFNFDSADWFVGGWLHSYQYASHPITTGMRDDMNDAGIVIGASLSAKPPAFPLVIGKYGYSDPGEESAGDQRGYLGNLNYDPGEFMGDVVLCAAQHSGKGKVLVFGDTSAFANAILVNSHDFVNRVFSWLARDESPTRYRLALVASLVLFIVALFCYLTSNRTLQLLLISLIVAFIMVWLAERIKNHDNQTTLQSGNIAYIDTSHGERFSPESWNENAVMGLYLNLMRNGYLPFSLRTFQKERLEHAQLLVLIAPSAPFTRGEIQWIREFVNNGGVLIMSVGWEEKEASVPLLHSFGFAIDHLPLAQFISVIPPANQRVKFFEAWPVLSTDGSGEIIAAYQNYPVIIKKVHGKGRVVLIGDSSFFWNVNLEMEESPIQENVNFLKWLLQSLRVTS